jgi:hypothetical protein
LPGLSALPYDDGGGAALAIELTPQQQDAIDRSSGEPVAVVDPRTNAAYVLVAADRFETLAEIADDQRFQRAIRDTAFRNAIRRAECEP